MNAERLLQHFERISEAPDAIPRLRRFILDLAVRGQLFPQDPKDEPAAELLKRIQAEKARLVRERKLRQQAPSPKIAADQEPFQLPKSWAWSRLGEVIALLSGQHLQPNEYSDNKQSGPPYVTGPADFSANGLIISRYALVRKAVATEGQLLLTVKGAGVGKTTTCDVPEVAISRQLMALTAISWNQHFLSLTTHLLAETLKESARSLIPGISREDVELFVFGLPPLAEQHRIVAKVDELMALCDQLEDAKTEREQSRNRLVAASLHRLNQPADIEEANTPDAFRDHARFIFNHLPCLTTRPAHIKQLRQTILNLAVRGQLVPQDPNDEPVAELLKRIQAEKAQLVKEGKIRKQDSLPLITEDDQPFLAPDGWRWERLANVSRKIHYGFTASANAVVKTVRLLRITDIQDNSVNWDSVPGCEIADEQVDQFKLEAGDILIARTGGTIGKSFLVTQIPVTAVFASYLIRVQGSANLYDRFLKLFVESPVYWEQLEGGTRGTGQPNVNGQTLGRMAVPLPPLAEQHRIVAKVDELMVLCDQLEAQLTTTEADSRRLLEAVLHEALAPALEETA